MSGWRIPFGDAYDAYVVALRDAGKLQWSGT